MIDHEDEASNYTVPLSALQHYSYCPRQCALIHVEQVFEENIFTMKGKMAHKRVDEENVRSSSGYKILTALPVWSDQYGIVGKCDVIELHDEQPYPVEFKHGERKNHLWDEVQLCGEAICLEEMFHTKIPEGAIYHISSRRRRTVPLTIELREHTLRLVEEVRLMIRDAIVPPAIHDARCNGCSLKTSCMPDQTNGHHQVGWHEMMMRMEM